MKRKKTKFLHYLYTFIRDSSKAVIGVWLHLNVFIRIMSTYMRWCNKLLVEFIIVDTDNGNKSRFDIFEMYHCHEKLKSIEMSIIELNWKLIMKEKIHIHWK